MKKISTLTTTIEVENVGSSIKRDISTPFTSFLVQSKRIKSIFLTLFILLAGFTASKADCTISNISASNFIASYGTCTGTLTIPAGVTFTIDANLTIPASINVIHIKNGGQISWSANRTLTLSSNTAIVIDNTSTTSGVKALFSHPCNNNRRIHIGTVEYAACAGQGNVCITFDNLISAGGTIRPQPSITLDDGETGEACFPSFSLSLVVTGYTLGTLTYQWTQVS